MKNPQPTQAALALILAHKPDEDPAELSHRLRALTTTLIPMLPTEKGRMPKAAFDRLRQRTLDALASLAIDVGEGRLHQSAVLPLLQQRTYGAPLRQALDAIPTDTPNPTDEMLQQLTYCKAPIQTRRQYEYDLMHGIQYFAYDPRTQRPFVLHPMYRFLLNRR